MSRSRTIRKNIEARAVFDRHPHLECMPGQFIDMKDERNRLQSFHGKWLKEYPVLAHAVAQAGFYYVGPHDRVVCPFCGGRVFNWNRGDSPLGEHVRLFPHCPFVQASGEVASLLDVTPGEEGEGGGRESSSSLALPPPLKSGTESLLEIKHENQRLKASNTCRVCFHAEVRCVFLHCSHLVCCIECAGKVYECPLCRAPVLGFIKTYRA